MLFLIFRRWIYSQNEEKARKRECKLLLLWNQKVALSLWYKPLEERWVHYDILTKVLKVVAILISAFRACFSFGDCQSQSNTCWALKFKLLEQKASNVICSKGGSSSLNNNSWISNAFGIFQSGTTTKGLLFVRMGMNLYVQTESSATRGSHVQRISDPTVSRF